MYDYLIGTFILGGGLWCWLFFKRPDLRKAMLWSGAFYFVITTLGFIAYKLGGPTPPRSITPGYWSPPTLFNLGRKTGGYAIEDVLYMIFIAGTITALPKALFRQKVSKRRISHPKVPYALAVGLLFAAAFQLIFERNAIYLLIIFNLVTTLVMLWQRRDLIQQTLVGASIFFVVYVLQFALFQLIFPHFTHTYYNYHLTSGIRINGAPVEEYLFALSFGLVWASAYEYYHQLKPSHLKFGFKLPEARSPSPRRLSPAAEKSARR